MGTYEAHALSRRGVPADRFATAPFDPEPSPDASANAATGKVAAIKAAITCKRDWKAKLMSAQLLKNWRAEALAQGAEAAAFDRAVEELRADDYFSLEGIAFRDDCLPGQLLKELEEQLDAVAARSKDFHPDSGGMVRNLVHPSLFCYVHGASFAPQPVVSPKEASLLPAAKFGHCFVGVQEWSRYQWLPAEVDVDEGGKVRFASYVNNAPEDPKLLEVLQRSLAALLPSFEQVVTKPGSRSPVSLRNRRLQVIVKAANYELLPGQCYEGGWHVEGMLHERIAAAGIVYYAASGNARGEGLAFRRLRNRNAAALPSIPVEDLGGNEYAERRKRVTVDISDEEWATKASSGQVEKAGEEEEEEDEEEERLKTGFMKPKYQLSGESVKPAALWDIGYKGHHMPNHVELGVVETPPGRALVFKNSLQHRVQTLWNSSKTEKAVRKVLVFWLVDPENRVVSTADVPRQQWDMQRHQLSQVLSRQWKPERAHAKLSQSVVALILAFAQFGFTLEEARSNRLSLMSERKFSREVVDGKFEAQIQREYSFCEH